MKNFYKFKNTLYAHHENAERKETLDEHFRKTEEYYDFLNDRKDLNAVFKRIYEIFSNNGLSMDLNMYLEMIRNTIYYHDIGKCNVNFQISKMKNSLFKNSSKNKLGPSEHSLLSSVLYFNYYYSEFKKSTPSIADNRLKYYFLIINAYVISKHHTSLYNFDYFVKFYENIDEFIEVKDYTAGLENFDFSISLEEIVFIQKELGLYETQINSELATSIYIYAKILYSVLLNCDYFATSDFFNSIKIDDLGEISDCEDLINQFENSSIVKSVRAFQKNNHVEITRLNECRTKLFLEVEKNFLNNPTANFMYLDAPTGSGKTFISINIALLTVKFQGKRKIFYVFPYNTLIDQTKQVLDNIFVNYSSSIAVINSVTGVNTINGDDEFNNYERLHRKHLFHHYPICLISHVRLFNALFGISKDDNAILFELINSVIIFDEIQAYKNNIWKEIITMLRKYSELLNITIIVMSATLPKLDNLLDTERNFNELINKEFAESDILDIFKERVIIDESLLVENFSINDLKNKIIENYNSYNKKILVECIKRDDANNLYTELQSAGIENVLVITGAESAYYRKVVIDYVKNFQDKIILICTQLIEAGVDIDMDIGFKNVTYVDSEEQFLGRINRSAEKDVGIVYLFWLTDPDKIYGMNDLRQDYKVYKSENSAFALEVLKSKEFYLYYQKVFEKISNIKNSSTKLGIEEFYKKLFLLEFSNIEKAMKLIDEKSNSILVFNYRIRKEFINDKLIDFLNLDYNVDFKDGYVTGSMIWDIYKSIVFNKTLSYSEWKVKMSLANELLEFFSFKINGSFTNFRNDEINNMFYIADYSNYLEEIVVNNHEVYRYKKGSNGSEMI